ncbi:MAG: EAL domain-containing protein [Gammaproteobacteria bacterium]|nr:EAL domain-containing protein [Gammaproteobacteria bacterium]
MSNSRSLRSQITGLSTAAVIFTSLTLLAIFWWSYSNYNFAQLERKFTTSQSVLTEYLAAKEQLLTTAARVLTADFGFKQAVASNDQQTIASVLENHGSRIDADLMILFDERGQLISSNNAMNDLQDQIAKQISGKVELSSNAQFVVLNDALYEIIMLPIKAPNTIGFCIIGFEIDDQAVSELNQLTMVELSFYDEQKQLIISSNKYSAVNTVEFTIDSISPLSLFIKRPIAVHKQNFFEQSQRLYVSTSIAMQPIYQEFDQLALGVLLLALFIILLGGLTSRWYSTTLTTPLKQLVTLSQQFAKGNYQAPKKSTSINREVELLTSSVINMGAAIQNREQEIRFQARHDHLTKLYNRQTVIEELNRRLAEQSSLIVIALNIRGFRRINDVLGASIGDNLLIAVKNQLSTYAVAIQSQYHDVLHGRIGGDEFLLAIDVRSNNADKEQQCNKICEEVLELFEKDLKVNQLALQIKLRMGVCWAPEHGSDAKDIIRRVNIALDYARSESVNIRYYKVEEEQLHLRKMEIIENLKRTIDNAGDEFSIVFQPKINVKTKQIDKVESLIRWRDQQGNFVSPELFIELAEQSGLIIQITQWVIKQVLSHLAEFRAEGISLHAAINVSCQDISHSHFIDYILEQLAYYKVSPNDITLELTERDIMQNEDLIIKRLHQLEKIGFTLSVDDYGIGQSSLAKLKQLPVQELKIDKSFILELDSSLHDQYIVESTIQLGHKLGLSVVAEGVETETALQLLQNLGCDHAQGYYLSRPLSIENFFDWIRSYEAH